MVVHGFAGHRAVMWPLSRWLRKFNYQVQNWGYRSLWKTIPKHAQALQSSIEAVEEDASIETLHIVAHSMGSIITRTLLKEYRPSKLQRIVMIGPPNRGSHIARRFSPLFGWLSTTLTQISDETDSFVNQIGHEIPAGYEVGIIQARSDLVVDLPNTYLEEAREYLQLPGFHSSVLFRKQTAVAVNSFLKSGSFENPPEDG